MKMITVVINFVGRENTAIGKCYPIKVVKTVSNNASKEKIILDLYDHYDHISQVKINEL